MMKKESLFIILRVNASSTLPFPIEYSHLQIDLWMFSNVKKNSKIPNFLLFNDWFTANMVPYVSNYDQEHMVLILIVNLVYSQLYSYWQFDHGDSIYKR